MSFCLENNCVVWIVQQVLICGVAIRENPCFSSVWGWSRDWVDWVRLKWSGCSHDPEGEWICQIVEDDVNTFCEIYFDSREKDDDDPLPSIISSLVLARIRNTGSEMPYRMGSYVIADYDSKQDLTKAKLVQSPVVSAIYSHPDWEGGRGVDMDLSKEYCIEGNEVFSAAFVWHWLRANVGPHVPFDRRYVVHLLLTDGDGDMEVVVLRWGKFVRLLDGGYEVEEQA